MSLKAVYNEIASHYVTADQFGAISQSHAAAIAQIKRSPIITAPKSKVLDLGVGNGAFLKRLATVLPTANFTGIDISPKMLKYARENLLVKTIEASATEASHYLPHHSQDLVLAHFINAYIPIHTLFAEADLLARANGYFSFITTTYESFPNAQQHLANFISQGGLLSSVVGHYYKSMTKNTMVASGLDELLKVFSQHRFKIIQHERLYVPILIEDTEALVRFGIDGTWFLNSLSIKMLPKHFLLSRFKRLFRHIIPFPYHDMHIIDVILAKK
ncbi:MAG: class I SAM-dependent methyltransferase [Legionella sp.]|nr:class I SAM-dependent methyltransferase [Legionella sp.]